MTRAQLDLFSGAGVSPERVPALSRPPAKPPEAYNDRELLAAFSVAGLAASPSLAQEAGRRRLAEAVPVLDGLCRRFAGFGRERLVPEQVAALEALEAIGTREAAGVVQRLIFRQAVQGPTLRVALAAAARLGVTLGPTSLLDLLGHDDPVVRAGACRCVRTTSAAPVQAALLELLSDLREEVTAAAACALGRLGRPEARFSLERLLDTAPSSEVVEALAAIADEDALVLLGRSAREHPELVPVVLAALEDSDLAIAARIRRSLLSPRPRPGC